MKIKKLIIKSLSLVMTTVLTLSSQSAFAMKSVFDDMGIKKSALRNYYKASGEVLKKAISEAKDDAIKDAYKDIKEFAHVENPVFDWEDVVSNLIVFDEEKNSFTCNSISKNNSVSSAKTFCKKVLLLNPILQLIDAEKIKYLYLKLGEGLCKEEIPIKKILEDINKMSLLIDKANTIEQINVYWTGLNFYILLVYLAFYLNVKPIESINIIHVNECLGAIRVYGDYLENVVYKDKDFLAENKSVVNAAIKVVSEHTFTLDRLTQNEKLILDSYQKRMKENLNDIIVDLFGDKNSISLKDFYDGEKNDLIKDKIMNLLGSENVRTVFLNKLQANIVCPMLSMFKHIRDKNFISVRSKGLCDDGNHYLFICGKADNDDAKFESRAYYLKKLENSKEIDIYKAARAVHDILSFIIYALNVSDTYGDEFSMQRFAFFDDAGSHTPKSTFLDCSFGEYNSGIISKIEELRKLALYTINNKACQSWTTNLAL